MGLNQLITAFTWHADDFLTKQEGDKTERKRECIRIVRPVIDMRRYVYGGVEMLE